MRRVSLETVFGLIALLVVGLVLSGGAATAAEPVPGLSRPWEIGMQPAHSPVMERVHEFHNLLLVIITSIVVFVLGLLGFIIIRFNARRNPVPSKTTHNTLLEVVWTAVPIMILIVIAIPSMRLLFFANKAETPEMTLKVIGHQWYWSYAYPDHGDLTFDSLPIADSEIDVKAGQVRLLSVDNPVVVPVGTQIQVLVSSDDVIHNWAVPSLALKKDATPGRVNETWVQINTEGTYYGMCSELCGVNHYFMPIEIRAVSKDAFASWVEEAKQKFASRPQPAVAAAQSSEQ
jgi:cytochrome c oxidase subunit 2